MQAARTFRVFVSSTFDDLEAERNALQKRVFPRLRQLCMAHGARFHAIDLRWGVSREASLDQRALPICLAEIERCRKVSPRPNFIVLLGDRYGWCPIPAEIPEAEFEEILSRVSDGDERSLLLEWYRHDVNAVPPVWWLQPRTGEWEDSDRWAELEASLHRVIQGATTDFDEASRRKYVASATEQEIEAGVVAQPRAAEHVFAFFRTIHGAPDDGSATRFHEANPEFRGRLTALKERLRGQLGDQVLDYEVAWTGDGNRSPITLDHLDVLCDDVYAALQGVILRELAGLEEQDALDLELEAHARFRRERTVVFVGREPSLARITSYLASDQREPLVLFAPPGSGKSALIARAVARHLEPGAAGEPPTNLVVERYIGITPSSSRVRSLLVALCQQIYSAYGHERFEAPAEDDELFAGFQAALRFPTAGKKLLLFLDGLDQFEDIEDIHPLLWLPGQLPAHVRLVISTMSPPCPTLSALQQALPARAFVELEPLRASDGSQILAQWLLSAGRELTPDQRSEVLAKFSNCGNPLFLKLAFEEVRRWRSSDDFAGGSQVQRLAEDVDSAIRRLFTRLASPAEHGEHLVSHCLGYLVAARHGLTEDELVDLLSQDRELVSDLSRRAYHTPDEARVPTVVWSRLLHDLEPYLTERQADGTTLLVFYHRRLAHVAREMFLAGAIKKQRHRLLANYFAAHPLTWTPEPDSRPNSRKIAELPYQLTCAEEWLSLEQHLTDLRFIQEKCAADAVFDLIADYRTALANSPDDGRNAAENAERRAAVRRWIDELLALAGRREERSESPPAPPQSISDLPPRVPASEDGSAVDRLKSFFDFARRRSHVFSRWPRLVPVEAHNDADGGPVVQAASDAIRTRGGLGHPWFRLAKRTPFVRQEAWVCSLHGHTEPISAVGLSADGALAVSGGEDGLVCIWDVLGGRCTHVLRMHSAPISSVDLSVDGRTAISGSEDGTARIWDTATGRCLQSLVHDRGVSSVSLDAGGRLALTTDRRSLFLWDTADGVVARSIHQAGVSRSRDFSLEPPGVCFVVLDAAARFAATAARDIVSVRYEYGTDDLQNVGEVAYYDLVEKEAAWSLSRSPSVRFDLAPITALAMTPCARRVAASLVEVGFPEEPRSQYADRGYGDTVVWTVEIRRDRYGVENLATPHREFSWCAPLGLALSPDGRLALTGHADGMVRCWDADSGEAVRILRGHAGCVRAVALAADAVTAVSGGDDRTVRIWDLRGTSLENEMILGERRRLPKIDIGGAGVTSELRAGSNAKEVTIVPVEGGDAAAHLVGHRGVVHEAQMSRDGRHVFSISNDGTLRLWEPLSRRFLSLSGFDSKTPFAVAPDGGHAASGHASGEVVVWNMSTARRHQTMTGHEGRINALAYACDGKLLASAGADGSVRLWDTANHAVRAVLAGHDGKVLAVAFTPDCGALVSSGDDHTIRIWEVQSAELLHTQFLELPAVGLARLKAHGSLKAIDSAGATIPLVIEELRRGLPVVTACKAWTWDSLDPPAGHWKDGLWLVCEWCEHAFSIQDASVHHLPSSLGGDHTCPECGNDLVINPFVYQLSPGEEQLLAQSANGATGMHHPLDCTSANAVSYKEALAGYSGPRAKDAAEALEPHQFCPECDHSLEPTKSS